MIKFVPISSDKLDIDSIDNTYYGYFGYDLSKNGEYCGQCVFKHNGYSMDIIKVEVNDNDAETAEGLIRSSLNYCANRGSYIAYFHADKFEAVARLLGFTEDKNEELSSDIPALLQGSCCKKGD